MPLGDGGLVELSTDECRRLLAGHEVGRVVLSINALPAALPVNYGVFDDKVVFRTSSGGKLTAALDHAVVGFEVDDIDATVRSGWSVLVVGAAEVVTDSLRSVRLEQAGIVTWMPDPRTHFVTITIERISGRRLGPAAATSID